ncbi:MAG: 3'(2'),5'-bisphosphate nucleotidase CysQ [Bacteroidales bacterium]|nr:3'(2'),5'-bisphosphate nucleotidase CysQ [Bacteroidales bacterium]
MINEQELLQAAITAAINGANEILGVYGDEFEVEYKEDKSPLTLADRRAHEAIIQVLKKTGLPVLSEEGRDIPYDLRKEWKEFWLVDPLDGTKEFIRRNGEFTVNIALIRHNIPVSGVILVPVSRLLYFASRSAGAHKIALDHLGPQNLAELIKNAVKLPLQKGLKTYTVVGSRSHASAETSEFINDLRKTEPELEFISIGSSLKMCLVAEGRAHIYPRLGPTMEWDTAAGQAIVENAGGKVLQVNSKEPVQYNKPVLLNPWFVASLQQ